jgi:hypothetical protein
MKNKIKKTKSIMSYKKGGTVKKKMKKGGSCGSKRMK